MLLFHKPLLTYSATAVSPICQLQLYLTVSPTQINTGNGNMLETWSPSWCQNDWWFQDGGNHNHDPLQRQPVIVNTPISLPKGNSYLFLFFLIGIYKHCNGSKIHIQIACVTEIWCNQSSDPHLTGPLRHLHQGWSRRTAMRALQWAAWGHKHPSCRTQPVASGWRWPLHKCSSLHKGGKHTQMSTAKFTSKCKKRQENWIWAF